jgi:hypothetical protein
MAMPDSARPKVVAPCSAHAYEATLAAVIKVVPSGNAGDPMDRNSPIKKKIALFRRGAHAWIFFDEPIPAASARRLGAFLITDTMERVPDIGFKSYDRFFPSQDSIPVGGFGNLIALPLQGLAQSSGNSEFIDEFCSPYPDQWAFLSAII